MSQHEQNNVWRRKLKTWKPETQTWKEKAATFVSENNFARLKESVPSNSTTAEQEFSVFK